MHTVRDSGDTGDLPLRSDNYVCSTWSSVRQRTEVYVTWQDGTTFSDEPATDFHDICSEQEPLPPPDEPEPEPEAPPPPTSGIAWLISHQCSDGFSWYPGVVRYCAPPDARPDVLATQTNGCAFAACESQGMELTGVDVPIPDHATPCGIINQCGW
jgi:hypothetical protein